MQLLNINKVQEGYYSVDSLPCPECKTKATITIQSQQLWDYNQGEHAQTVLPDLSNGERERFISGLCDPCWQTAFPILDEHEQDEFYPV